MEAIRRPWPRQAVRGTIPDLPDAFKASPATPQTLAHPRTLASCSLSLSLSVPLPRHGCRRPRDHRRPRAELESPADPPRHPLSPPHCRRDQALYIDAIDLVFFVSARSSPLTICRLLQLLNFHRPFLRLAVSSATKSTLFPPSILSH